MGQSCYHVDVPYKEYRNHKDLSQHYRTYKDPSEQYRICLREYRIYENRGFKTQIIGYLIIIKLLVRLNKVCCITLHLKLIVICRTSPLRRHEDVLKSETF